MPFSFPPKNQLVMSAFLLVVVLCCSALRNASTTLPLTFLPLDHRWNTESTGTRTSSGDWIASKTKSGSGRNSGSEHGHHHHHWLVQANVCMCMCLCSHFSIVCELWWWWHCVNASREWKRAKEKKPMCGTRPVYRRRHCRRCSVMMMVCVCVCVPVQFSWAGCLLICNSAPADVARSACLLLFGWRWWGWSLEYFVQYWQSTEEEVEEKKKAGFLLSPSAEGIIIISITGTSVRALTSSGAQTLVCTTTTSTASSAPESATPHTSYQHQHHHQLTVINCRTKSHCSTTPSPEVELCVLFS